MPYKKTIIFLTIILILLITVYLIYNTFFKDGPVADPIYENGEIVEPGPENWETELTPSPEAKIKVLSQEPAFEPVIDGQRVKYFSADNGNIYQSNLNGSDLVSLSSIEFLSLKKALWSSNKNQVINIFEENGELIRQLYDLANNQTVSLNKNIQWVSWSPQGDRIAYQYIYDQAQISKISISNPDGSDWQHILSTRIKNLIIEWPALNQISLRTRPSGLAYGSVLILNPLTKELKQLLQDVYGLSVLWSPQGDEFLYSKTDNQGKNLKLKIANNQGQITTQLDIVTLTEKCAWSQDSRIIYCAVPKEIPSQSVLPDDYYKGLVTTNDEFWRINIETKHKSLIEIPEEYDFDAYNLLLSDKENYLVFINKIDGLLYSIELD